MDDYVYSIHVEAMLAERNTLKDWVEQAILEPDQVNMASDDNHHYIKAIPDFGGRYL